MVFSVEAYVGAEGGAEGLKLEEQVLVADTGTEVELGEWRGSNRGGPIRHSGGSRRCRNGRCRPGVLAALIEAERRGPGRPPTPRRRPPPPPAGPAPGEIVQPAAGAAKRQ